MKKNTNKTLNILRRLATATLLATLLATIPTTTHAQTASALAVQMVDTSYNNKTEQASYKLIVDGVNKTSEVTFKVQNNRSMIGLRQFSNALGATVDWDTKKVAIVRKGSTTIEVPIGSKEILVNGNKKAIDTQGTVSIIVDSSTYLPFRVIAESLGYTVNYNNNTKTITCTSQTTQQQPQPVKEIPNPYNVQVPEKYKNTTWLLGYNFLRENGQTNEQALETLSHCNPIVAGNVTGSMTTEQQIDFGHKYEEYNNMAYHNIRPTTHGEYQFQYKDGYFWMYGQWCADAGMYACIGTLNMRN